MTSAHFKDVQVWCLGAALLLMFVSLALPRVEFQREAYDVLAIVDITGSMQARDMGSDAKPESRLDATKRVLQKLLAELPCQSRLGLGVFTERRTFLLFTPVEVCADFAPIDQAIAGLDWRMGWEGDSFVAKGLYSAIELAKGINADVIFFTDGHEAPPLPPGSDAPPFEGKIGDVRGIIAGVGGQVKVPIPKFDDDGRETGVYGPQDVMQENHAGPPPPDAEKRPGYHPKWAPFGTAVAEGEEHLTSVKSAYLGKLAALTGLGYREVKVEPNLARAIADEARPRPVIVPVDLRPWAAACALAFLAAVYGAPLVARARTAFSTLQSGYRS